MPSVTTPPACLIIEPLAVVAHDLATTLRDTLNRPALVAASEAQASTLLAEMDPATVLHVAIIHMSPKHFAESPLRPLIEARTARVILMGSDSAPSGASWPWAVLSWPFGTEQLLSLLDTLGLMNGPR